MALAFFDANALTMTLVTFVVSESGPHMRFEFGSRYKRLLNCLLICPFVYSFCLNSLYIYIKKIVLIKYGVMGFLKSIFNKLF